MIISTININAQNKESTDLNSIVDYVTCVCVNDALPDANKVTCDNGPLTLSAIPATEKSTIALFNEFQKLKEKTNINDNLRFFTDEVFNDEKQYSKIYAFAERRKLKNTFAPIKLKIEIFIQNKETETDLNPDQSTTELGDLENSATENQDSLSTIDMDVRSNTIPPAAATFYSFNFWSLFSIGLIILSIVLFFILNKQKSKVKKDFENQIKSLKDRNKNELNFLANEYSTKINRLEHQIKVKSIEIQNDFKKDYSSDTANNTILEINNEIELKVPPKPVQEEFYMATPDLNNFDLSSLSNTFKPTQSLYKFTVDNQDKSKASFVFHSDEIGIKDAVNYPHRYLEPVCEPQNALNQNARNINTIKPGIAEKRNDKWVVTTKAKIKYE